MSAVKCNECGKQISLDAKKCPYCKPKSICITTYLVTTLYTTIKLIAFFSIFVVMTFFVRHCNWFNTEIKGKSSSNNIRETKHSETPSETLASIDKATYHTQYEPRHYDFLLDQIEKYTNVSDKKFIAALINKAQMDLENKVPGLTLYEVARGIKNVAEEFYYREGTKQDLRTITAWYMTLTEMDS